MLGTGSQEWIFLFFAAAFLVKMPAFLVHGWMPDAYRAAPLPVLALLSGVLSKVGAYGFLRIVLPLYPQATVHFQELILLIALASILYGSVMAFTQRTCASSPATRRSRSSASSPSGSSRCAPTAATGAVLQMVNHGLVVGAVFFIVAILWERAGTEDLNRLGGLAMRAPVLAALFLIVALATLAMPGSANFTGEFYILLGVFQSKIVFAFVAVIGVALAAFYSLRLFQRTMHNRLAQGVESREIGLREAVVLVPVVACILALALYPGLITKRADTSVDGSLGRRRRATAARADQQVTAAGPDAPVRAMTDERLHRPAHRLRRALADHRAQRGVLRRAHRRRCSPRRPPAGGRLRPDARHPRRGRRPVHLAVDRGAEATRRRRAPPRRPGPRGDADRDLRGRLRRAAELARGLARAAGGAGRPRRVPGAPHLLGPGHDHPRPGAERDRALHRPRAALDPALRDVRLGAAPQAVARIRPQVPDRRLARVRHAALRARLPLRRRRLHGLPGDPRRGRLEPRRRPADPGRDRARGRRGSRSRPRLRRSTSGRPTSTRARPRR